MGIIGERESFGVNARYPTIRESGFVAVFARSSERNSRTASNESPRLETSSASQPPNGKLTFASRRTAKRNLSKSTIRASGILSEQRSSRLSFSFLFESSVSPNRKAAREEPGESCTAGPRSIERIVASMIGSAAILTRLIAEREQTRSEISFDRTDASLHRRSV